MLNDTYSKNPLINPSVGRKRRDTAFIRALKPRIMERLEKHGVQTIGQLVQRLQVPRWDCWCALLELQKQGKITLTKMEKTSGASYYVVAIVEGATL
jgi:hypothetical protein